MCHSLILLGPVYLSISELVGGILSKSKYLVVGWGSNSFWKLQSLQCFFVFVLFIYCYLFHTLIFYLALFATGIPPQQDQTRWTLRSVLQKLRWPQRRSFTPSESTISIQKHKKKRSLKIFFCTIRITCGAADNHGRRGCLRSGCTYCGRRATQSWARTTL